MNKNMEMMKKLIEEKKAKGNVKQGRILPDKFGNQSNGSGKIRNSAYGK